MHPFRDVGRRKPSFKKFQVWWNNDDICVELAATKSQWEKIGRARRIHLTLSGRPSRNQQAGAFFAKKVVIKPTAQAIRAFNEASGEKIGLFHVTC
jgi:hypothetical protein